MVIGVATANYKVKPWLNEVANQHCHGTTSAIPFVRLQQEQLALQEIPVSYLLGSRATSQNCYSSETLSISEMSLQHALSIYDDLLQEGASA